MRLIDADALVKALNESGVPYRADVQEVLDAQPTIDAVPVVRCKDCKRRRSAAKNGRVYWDGYEYYCEIAHYGVLDDGFCFYGEREDDE